jgi:GntR family transcriptional regulator
MEVESVDEGVVKELLVAEGTEGVKVNTPIALVLAEGETAAATPAAKAAPEPAEAPVVPAEKAAEAAPSLAAVPAAPKFEAQSDPDLPAGVEMVEMTVRQALDALVAEGLLERMPGRGTFVAQRKQRASSVMSFTEEMRRRGFLPESLTLLARVEQAGPGVARALDISPGDPVIHWKRLRRADQQLVCIEDAFLNEVLLPGFLQSGMPTSLYEALEARGLRPNWAEDSIAADGATAEEADLLELRAGSPVLRYSRRALALGKLVEVSRSVYRPDRFTVYHQIGGDAHKE